MVPKFTQNFVTSALNPEQAVRVVVCWALGVHITKETVVEGAAVHHHSDVARSSKECVHDMVLYGSTTATCEQAYTVKPGIESPLHYRDMHSRAPSKTCAKLVERHDSSFRLMLAVPCGLVGCSHRHHRALLLRRTSSRHRKRRASPSLMGEPQATRERWSSLQCPHPILIMPEMDMCIGALGRREVTKAQFDEHYIEDVYAHWAAWEWMNTWSVPLLTNLAGAKEMTMPSSKP